MPTSLWNQEENTPFRLPHIACRRHRCEHPETRPPRTLALGLLHTSRNTVYHRSLSQVSHHTFTLPPSVCIVKAQTLSGSCTRMLMVK